MKFLALVVGAAALSFAALGAEAAIIFTDGFDTENGGVEKLNYNTFANWTVDPTVDLIGNGGSFDFYPGNGLYVDLDGSTTGVGAGGLMSNLFFSPGSYTLSFQLGGSQRGDINTVEVSLGSYFESFTLAATDPLATYMRAVTVLGPDQLVFQQTGAADFIGVILDDVSVADVASVPEPATLALFGAGLLGLAAIRRRRNAKA